MEFRLIEWDWTHLLFESDLMLEYPNCHSHPHPENRQRLAEPVENAVLKDEGDDRADHNRDDGDDEARAQLIEVLDERRLFAVAKAPRPPHLLRWGRARVSQPKRSTRPS